MKKLLQITLVLWLPIFAFAQPEDTRLKDFHQSLQNAANDTLKMDIYLNLALYYNTISPDSAIHYLERGLPLAQKLNLKLYEAHFLENRGYMLTRIGNYAKAHESFLAALKIAEDPASEKYTWNLAETQTPRKERLTKLAYLHLTMGHLYGATNNQKMQISSYLQSKAIAESINHTELVTGVNWNLGMVYIRQNKLDSALLLIQTNLELEGPYRGGVLFAVGYIYELKGDSALAKNTYQKALKAASEENNLFDIAKGSVSLGSLYHNMNYPDSSLYYARKAMVVSQNALIPEETAASYQLISDIYAKQEKGDSAHAYLKLAMTIRDSLYNARIENLLAYQNINFEEQFRLQKLEEERIKTQARNRIYMLLAGLTLFMLIAFLLYRNNKNKQKANKLLREQKEEIQTTLEQLESTQSQLIQSEKMASLGELTAGIAHEIQNPLNFVNNFSEVNSELIEEAQEENEKKNSTEVKLILNDIKENESKISHHGKRAESIVKGMLMHSRGSSGKKEPTNINALCDEYVRLAYHGFRAKDKSFNADFKLKLDESLPKVEVVPEDIGRVLLNLINNAFYAVNKRSKALTPQSPEGGTEKSGKKYKPLVTLSASYSLSIGEGRARPDDTVGQGEFKIIVADNGPGIPDKIKEKIFQPFFTTKSTGEGTGLGLSLSYDIIKAHGGELTVESIENQGTVFKITLPL